MRALRTVEQTVDNAEKRVIELGLGLPPPVTPFGQYVEAVKTGNLLFLAEPYRYSATN